MSREGFWDNPDAAQSAVSQLSALKSVIEPVEEVHREVEDLRELFVITSQLMIYIVKEKGVVSFSILRNRG